MPRFGGTSSWEQYRHVFDAIVLSNGWDDAKAALQLLAHLEGDALNIALLVPMSRQTSITGLWTHCRHIMGRRVDWRTIDGSLRKLSGQQISGQQTRQRPIRWDWNDIVLVLET